MTSLPVCARPTEQQMLGFPPSVSITKDDGVGGSPGAGDAQAAGRNPPIITHTAATPMPTPQGSPNETLANNKDMKNSLSVGRKVTMSSLSIDSIDNGTVSLSASLQYRPLDRGCQSVGGASPPLFRAGGRRRKCPPPLFCLKSVKPT